MSAPRRARPEAGQAAVEFAIVAGVLFTVIFAIIQMGLTFGKQLDLKSATREGARRAAVSMDKPDPTSIAKDAVRSAMTLSNKDDVVISVSPPPPWNHGDTLTVSTTVPHKYNVLGVASWEGNLHAKSQIRVE